MYRADKPSTTSTIGNFIHGFVLIFFPCRGVFKKGALKAENALKEAGYKVTINGDRPRKGAFVVTSNQHKDPLIELLSMPRPFTKLRELDLEAAVRAKVA